MILYRLSEGHKGIKIQEIEVEEKPKTYRARVFCGYSIINKSDIGKLNSYGTDAYFLTPDVEAYKEALKERLRGRIESDKKTIEHCIKRIGEQEKELEAVDGIEVSGE